MLSVVPSIIAPNRASDNEAQLYPLPTPTMKKDAMRRTSGADESIPEKRSGRLKVFRRKTRIGRIRCFRISTLVLVIHEIRKQQRSEERYVRGASHSSGSPKRLHPLFDTFPPPAFYHPRNRQYYHVL